MKMVALIPARAGSKRIPGKNTKLLAGMPLIYWTIRAAIESGVFADVQIWTDDESLHRMAAERWPVRTFVREPSTDDEPDINWVSVWAKKSEAEMFAILRPTSPFRTAETIRRAFKQFQRTPDVDSLRSVRLAQENPFKMWTWQGAGFPMEPLISSGRTGLTPLHSMPSQRAPRVWLQTGGLEMAWTRTVTQLGSIAGNRVLPFFMDELEAIDINEPSDWDHAERILHDHFELIPHVQTTTR